MLENPIRMSCRVPCVAANFENRKKKHNTQQHSGISRSDWYVPNAATEFSWFLTVVGLTCLLCATVLWSRSRRYLFVSWSIVRNNLFITSKTHNSWNYAKAKKTSKIVFISFNFFVRWFSLVPLFINLSWNKNKIR